MFKFVVQLSHSLVLVTESSNMAKNSLRHIVVLHEDSQGYRKLANTLKMSCSTVAKIIQRFKSWVHLEQASSRSSKEAERTC